MAVLDSDGNILRSWGEELFSRVHGLSIDPQIHTRRQVDQELGRAPGTDPGQFNMG
jgi:hypothetical protein